MNDTVQLQKVLGPMLRGKIDGRAHYGPLCSYLSRFRPGSIARLGFHGIEDLSASWIAATIIPLLSWASLPEIELYPVLEGVYGNDKKWEDEFEFVAAREHVAFLVADPESPERCYLVGELDAILFDTLRLVQEHREVTGAGLRRLVPDENIGATAWSNRLKELHKMRLVRRATRGREQLYSTVVEVIFDGTWCSGIAGRDVPAADAT
jgi:hypothetical protein